YRCCFFLQEFLIVPKTSTARHQMSVIIREPFSYPQTTCVGRPGKVPWSKFQWSQSLYIPDVKEFVCDSVESSVINTGLAECARLDDLSRGQMLHAVSRTLVGGIV